MNKIFIMFLLLTLLLSPLQLFAKSQQIYVETSLYFVPKAKDKTISTFAQMVKYYGGFNENHSTKNTALIVGNRWNLETRLNKKNQFNVFFWLNDKSNPKVNRNLDVSSLDLVTITLLSNEKGDLKLNLHPQLIKPSLSPVSLGMENFGLNHLCLKNSAVIIDDNFYMGKLSGFGEFVELRFPEFYRINLSMKPIKSWQAIGIYLNGVIKIDVDQEHILEMLNVGIGPSGMTKGGPFVVYGKISPPNDQTRAKYLKIENDYILNKLSKRLQKIIHKANKSNPYFSAGTTIGNEKSDVNKEHLYRVIGDFFKGFDCG